MKKILIVSGHPNIDGDSVANKAMLEVYGEMLPEAEIDRLDVLYPDYKFDAAAEQKKLIDADVILLQTPVFWYGPSALTQKWIEDVFVRGFSHGSNGNAVAGKKLFAVMTAGVPESDYTGAIKPEDLFVSVKGLCDLTGMEFAGYKLLFDVPYSGRTSDEACAEMASRAKKAAAEVAEAIKGL